MKTYTTYHMSVKLLTKHKSSREVIGLAATKMRFTDL